MSEYVISTVSPSDARALAAVDALLVAEGIRRDAHLDHTCAIFEGDRAIATGSCFGNTLRCLAVAADHQGEGLMNEVVTHLVEFEAARGVWRLFVYTKPSAVRQVSGLGFYEVARAGDQAVLMENRRGGFEGWLAALAATRVEAPRVGAIVMNANPFTLGHRHLVRYAAAHVDVLHLFVVSEDASLFPFAVRRRLVERGVADLASVVLHDSGPYMVSQATFPSYFLSDTLAASSVQAELEAAIFRRVADALGVRVRFVGEEPASAVTRAYNEALAANLPPHGVELVMIERLAGPDGAPVSASSVRLALQRGDLEAARALVPPTTYAYLASPEAAPVLERIRAAADVVHH